MNEWIRQSTDGSHYLANAKIACQQLGLDSSYESIFAEIAKDWESEVGSAGYLSHFVSSGILKLCKSPNDFKRASEIFLPYFKGIYSRSDGSM